MNFFPPADALTSSRSRNMTALTVLSLSDGIVATVDSHISPAFDTIVNAASPPTPTSRWLFTVADDWSIAEATLRLQFPDVRTHLVFDLVEDRAFLERVNAAGALTLSTVRRPDRPVSLTIDTGGLGDALAATAAQNARTPKAGNRARTGGWAPAEPMCVATGIRGRTLTVDTSVAGTSSGEFLSPGEYASASVDVVGGYLLLLVLPDHDEPDDGSEDESASMFIDLAPHRFPRIAQRILAQDFLRIHLMPGDTVVDCVASEDDMVYSMRRNDNEKEEELRETLVPIAEIRGDIVVLDTSRRPELGRLIAAGTRCQTGFTYDVGRDESLRVNFVFDFAGGERLTVRLDGQEHTTTLVEVARTGMLAVATTDDPSIVQVYPVEAQRLQRFARENSPLAA